MIGSLPPSAVPSTADDTRFFGHPRGLATLYFTEMWERFSYYGMRALLILFMTATVANGGLGFNTDKAGAIYGLYTAMAYLACLPGGWIADRILGARRSVLYGGIVIACGHFFMAVPTIATFYFGLVLIVIGTGLLKPNVSTMVGSLYAPGDSRRDAAFSIFYMGINVGAFLSPLACGYVGEKVNWHWGFGLAGIGMTAGLVQYMLGAKNLGTAGLYPCTVGDPVAGASDRRRLLYGILIMAAIAVATIATAATGVLPVTPNNLADVVGMGLIIVTAVLFGWLIFFAGNMPAERNRFIVIFVLFVAATFFWAVYEQAGSTLNLFAERNTDRVILGYEYPASWFQSVNSFFIFGLAPALAWLWVRLGKRDPSSPAKFSLGLMLVGLSFVVMVLGAIRSAGGTHVSSAYLWICYFIQTVGELLLSPVGLSAMTKLAPVRFCGLIMGIWFLATSLGNYIAGRLASLYETFSLPNLFGLGAAITIGLGLVLALLVRPIRRMIGAPH